MGYETLAVDANPNAIGFKHADKYKVINIVDEKTISSLKLLINSTSF